MPTAGRFTFFPVGFTRSFEPPLPESRHDIAVAKRPRFSAIGAAVKACHA
jgi:hypothetical protein